VRVLPGFRVLALAGGGFSKGAGGNAPVAFVYAEGIKPKRLIFREVKVDGLDATTKVLEVVGEIKEHVDAVMARSLPISGFNLIDPKAIFERTGIPTVFVLSNKPDEEAVASALRKHFEDWKARLEVLREAGAVSESPGDDGKVLLECFGISPENAFRVVRRLSIFGRVPEPLRIAAMAARAVSSSARFCP
jgi:endonuclease V-like protein UPF0215 family